MSEQQRVLLAIVLSIGIIWAWQAFFAPPPANLEPSPQPTTADTPESDASTDTGEKTDVETAPVAGTERETDGSDAEGDSAVVADSDAEGGDGTPPPPPIPVEGRTLETEEFVGEVHNRTVRLSRWELRQYQEHADPDADLPKKKDKRPVSLITARDDEQPYQARLVWSVGGADAPPMGFVDDVGHQLRAETEQGVELSVTIAIAEKPYALDYTLRAVNGSDAPVPLSAGVQLAVDAAKKKASGGLFSSMGSGEQVVTGVCSTQLGLERQTHDDLEEGSYAPESPARWAGIDKQYFVIGATSSTPEQGRCVAERVGNNLQVSYSFLEETVPPGGQWEKKLTLYLGPKRDEMLRQIEPTLIEIVDYNFIGIPLGFMARPMIWLLNLFHGWTNSWGIAIMILTLLVKVLLFPVTYKSIVSMRKMQLLKPELDKLKERWPDDRERQQLEQLKLFKDKGVNPLGGCLPMLLQMPVWIALYRALWTSVDLYQQSFLWLPDLTAKEPGIPFLALALGVTMLIQQMVTPMSAGTDNQQAKIMKWVMPPMFTFIMIGLPSGLVLYIFVNTVISIAQQAVINQRTKSL